MEPPGTSQRVDIQNDTRSGQSLSGGADDGEGVGLFVGRGKWGST
jgi:hypothetical protein